MSRRITLLLAVVVVLHCVLHGGSAGAQQPAPAGPRPPARARPAVDPLSASIQGRVTTADSGAPIRRAEVRAMSDRSVSRLVTTDGDGRFDLRDLPAGEYRLTASKSGFVSLTFGQRRPFEAAEVIALEQGQRVMVAFALPRAGVIAGRILDDTGEPLAQARVQALRARMVEGRRRLQPAGLVDLTDDTGAFRLYGLAPGDYFVSATARETAEPVSQGDTTGWSFKSTLTNYYPGTVSLAEAQPIQVGVGSEMRADMQVGPTRGALVAGIVLDSSGAPAGDAQISLQSEIVSMGVSAMLSGPPPLMVSAHTAPDGTFTFPDVPPGPYVLQASVSPDLAYLLAMSKAAESGAPPGPAIEMLRAGEQAVLPLVVSAADLTGLTITTGSGGTIEGTFARDDGVTQPLPTNLRVDSRVGIGNVSRMTQASTTFRLMGLIAPVRLEVSELPEGWTVKAIVVDGVDMTDQPIEVRNGRTAQVRILLTDRATEVTGAVAPPSFRDAAERRRDHTIVVFPADRAKWTYPSRYLRTTRADAQGAFRITGLPPERYLAVAVDYLEDGEGTDADFLERVLERATTFSLDEGERKTVSLTLLAR
jgi:hypothetical protein